MFDIEYLLTIVINSCGGCIIILIMDNPEIFLPSETIYAYDTHRNIPWNETEYQPVREYLDPNKQMTDRKYLSTPKGGKNMNYVTKRGFYMDYHIKTMKVVPSSAEHPPGDLWDQTINKKKATSTSWISVLANIPTSTR